jgi:hypothetical protein
VLHRPLETTPFHRPYPFQGEITYGLPVFRELGNAGRARSEVGGGEGTAEESPPLGNMKQVVPLMAIAMQFWLPGTRFLGLLQELLHAGEGIVLCLSVLTNCG